MTEIYLLKHYSIKILEVFNYIKKLVKIVQYCNHIAGSQHYSVSLRSRMWVRSGHDSTRFPVVNALSYAFCMCQDAVFTQINQYSAVACSCGNEMRCIYTPLYLSAAIITQFQLARLLVDGANTKCFGVAE
jgi:hypothetical protein